MRAVFSPNFLACFSCLVQTLPSSVWLRAFSPFFRGAKETKKVGGRQEREEEGTTEPKRWDRRVV